MSGRNSGRKEIKRWFEQAKLCANQLNLVGAEAVDYVKESLIEPASTRIRHARPKTLEEMEAKLLEAYADNKDDLEKRKELWCAQQGIREGVWEYLDRIIDLEEEAEGKAVCSKEREIMKCMIFEKGLRDRKIACDLKDKIENGVIDRLEDAGRFVQDRIKVMKEFGNVSDSYFLNRRRDDKVIKCWACGEQGHVSYECKKAGFSRDNIEQDHGEGHQYKGKLSNNRIQNKHVLENQFTGICWSCGNEGHPFYKCNLYSSKNRGINNSRGDKVVREMSLRAGDDAQENL